MSYSGEQIETAFNTICENIEKGMSLRNALKIENMPSSKTFYEWMDNNEQKVKQYARASEKRADAIFEDILDVADNQEDDVYYDLDGNEIINHNVIQRARLRVDSRKWMLSKMNPKKYGDRIQQDTNLSGSVNIISLGTGKEPDATTS